MAMRHVKEQFSDWYGDAHAGKDTDSSLGYGFVPDADASQKFQADGTFYGAEHAGKDTHSELGPGFVPSAKASQELGFENYYGDEYAGRDNYSRLGPGMVPMEGANDSLYGEGAVGGADRRGANHIGTSEEDEVAWLQNQFGAGKQRKRVIPANPYEDSMMRLRTLARSKALDMTDAFSEYAAPGRDGNLGVMPKARFQAAMGFLFAGDISRALLKEIALKYAAGDVDYTEAGGFTKVKWKQFAIDFDETPCHEAAMSDFDEVLADPPFYAELRKLRSAATNKRLDLSDAFVEYAGTGREANLGIMAKNRFRAAMGTIFYGTELTGKTLTGVCKVYGTGDADPTEPGTFKKVLYRSFAADFDDRIEPMAAPPKPDPTAEIVGVMREMNLHCNHHSIDLQEDFEEVLGGKQKCSSDVISRTKFSQALGVVMGTAASPYQLSEPVIDAICAAYAAGKQIRSRPTQYGAQYESVQWREFCVDVMSLEHQPYLAARPKFR